MTPPAIDPARTAVVLAAGGERVVPWQVGVLAGLGDAGVDLREAQAIIGTSAGAFVAARLATGVDQAKYADRIVERGVPAPPPGLAEKAAESLPELLRIQADAAGLPAEERCRRLGRFALAADTIPEEEHVGRLARRLPDTRWPAPLLLVTVDAESGERLPLDEHAGAGVVRGVAAARALPGVLPPVSVGGRPLIDAVVASATNADIAASLEVERVLVITPAAERPAAGTVDGALEAGLAAERAALERGDTSVHVIRPDADARVAMGEQLYEIVDAKGAVASGRRSGWRAVQGIVTVEA